MPHGKVLPCSQHVCRSCRIEEQESLSTSSSHGLPSWGRPLISSVWKHQESSTHNMAEEQEPFLPLDERTKGADSANPLSGSDRRRLPRKEWRTQVMVHSLLILIYTIASFAVIQANRQLKIFHPCQYCNKLITSLYSYGGQPHLKAWTFNISPRSFTICRELHMPDHHPQSWTLRGISSLSPCIFAFLE